MGKSTYISENLNEEQLALLKYLEDHEILYFKLKDLATQLPLTLRGKVNDLVENLNYKGLLHRIERGVYAKRNYANLNALATFVSQDSAVAYWSALHYHGLTERFPNILFIKTTQRKRDTQILGTAIKFVSVKEQKHIGIQQEGYGNDSFAITDVEMTLVDCFDQPRYAGNFSDLVKAFATAKLINKKLIAYTKAYRNIALTKRLGFLATLFHRQRLGSFIAHAQDQVNQKYSLIDAGGMQQGEFVQEWRLRLNVSREELLNMAQTEY